MPEILKGRALAEKYKMEKIVLSLAVIFAAATVNAATTNNKPVPGSREAGIQVAHEWLHGYFKAPSEPIARTSILHSTESSMMIQSQIRDKVCTLQIHKQASANNLGWVVTRSNCAEVFVVR